MTIPFNSAHVLSHRNVQIRASYENDYHTLCSKGSVQLPLSGTARVIKSRVRIQLEVWTHVHLLSLCVCGVCVRVYRLPVEAFFVTDSEESWQMLVNDLQTQNWRIYIYQWIDGHTQQSHFDRWTYAAIPFFSALLETAPGCIKPKNLCPGVQQNFFRGIQASRFLQTYRNAKLLPTRTNILTLQIGRNFLQEYNSH